MSQSIPRVTAIIIVLNGEKFIDEAIRSVLAQSLDDWELLVVDDGSTDRTCDIARAYVESDSRIRLIQHLDAGNHGMSASRNLGIEQARGEFVAFLDADDVWLPQKLAEQLALFDRHSEAAIVYGRTLIWYSWEQPSKREDHFYSLGVPADALYPPPRLFLQLLDNTHQTPTTCNAMVRRSAAIDVGGFDPSFRAMFEDQLFFAKLLVRYPAYVSGRCWAKYRQHRSSASAESKGPSAVRREHLRYLLAVRTHLAQEGRTPVGARLKLELTILRLRMSRMRRDLFSLRRH